MTTRLYATMQEQITEQFRQQILSGAFEPGERLREEHIARHFGVSRGPIRDTFVRLSREGLLEAIPNVGVRVAHPPSVFKRQCLLRIRRQIECDALRRAARTAEPDAAQRLLAALQANLAEYRRACRRGVLADVVRLDMAFHREIVAAADAGSLLTVWFPVISQLHLRYSRHTSLIESYEEHNAIVTALAQHGPARAAPLLRAHIV